MKKIVILLTATMLTACADTGPLQVMQGILGYIPPPEETTIAEELKMEFQRCEKIDPNRNCAQIAYDVVRTIKGLDPRKVPKGVVIILEGDVDVESSEKEDNKQPEK